MNLRKCKLRSAVNRNFPSAEENNHNLELGVVYITSEIINYFGDFLLLYLDKIRQWKNPHALKVVRNKSISMGNTRIQPTALILPPLCVTIMQLVQTRLALRKFFFYPHRTCFMRA